MFHFFVVVVFNRNTDTIRNLRLRSKSPLGKGVARPKWPPSPSKPSSKVLRIGVIFFSWHAHRVHRNVNSRSTALWAFRKPRYSCLIPKLHLQMLFLFCCYFNLDPSGREPQGFSIQSPRREWVHDIRFRFRSVGVDSILHGQASILYLAIKLNLTKRSTLWPTVKWKRKKAKRMHPERLTTKAVRREIQRRLNETPPVGCCNVNAFSIGTVALAGSLK